ncbi:MAG: ketopantoate reductase family protein [Alphaproteobacteria bacterium]|jgi:2-dehydropantoate 2-reductase|nr:ketopantoate reductase family protein [Alphaproteobacteria bacterium]MDP6256492.1 ketopantoate reductase family protein [Alphaproteobacteria bacterium]MDP7056339.1 ketopantoate reductase family protein [Alphaproteobacteria bacterium]MDP7228375.1 ketopantoate reductase family protein [Alphaproteobacteria bacterium]MDP7460801.1 ketopantoate reductase family protein [Alphaproteobacteria bacterium]|tara:strand:+ start:2068 stop:3027 length:960 start_codon:yes stop_codon:yes gene_type:complete
MRFVVLGAGALGTVIAAYLARAGEDVALIARGPRAKQLANEGVTITGLEDFTVEMEIVEQPSSLNSADVLIMATKTYDTAAAIDAVRHMKLGSIFSIQNGVMKNVQLAEAFGDDTVLGAIGMLGGAVEASGAANFMMDNPILVGELSGADSTRVADIVRALKNAKLTAAASNTILTEEWTKFVGWLGLSGLAVLTRQESWKFMTDKDGARIVARIMQDTAQLPQHLGIPLKTGPMFTFEAISSGDEDAVVAFLRRRGEAQSTTAPNFRQSMLQDVDKGKQFEVEETFGYTVRKAKEFGLSVPTVETCYRILSGLNRMLQ